MEISLLALKGISLTKTPYSIAERSLLEEVQSVNPFPSILSLLDYHEIPKMYHQVNILLWYLLQGHHLMNFHFLSLESGSYSNFKLVTQESL